MSRDRPGPLPLQRGEARRMIRIVAYGQSDAVKNHAMRIFQIHQSSEPFEERCGNVGFRSIACRQVWPTPAGSAGSGEGLPSRRRTGWERSSLGIEDHAGQRDIVQDSECTGHAYQARRAIRRAAAKMARTCSIPGIVWPKGDRTLPFSHIRIPNGSTLMRRRISMPRTLSGISASFRRPSCLTRSTKPVM